MSPGRPASLTAALVVVVASLGCAGRAAGPQASAAPAAAADRPPAIGDPMPDLVMQSLTGGGELRLSALRGKVVLLDIWASWCLPCKDEMPVLDELAARLAPRGVAVVAVSVDEERKNAQAFLDTRPSWALTVAHDPEGKVPERLQPTKMPTSYVIDAAGVLRHVNYGYLPGDGAKLESQLTGLVSGVAAQP